MTALRRPWPYRAAWWLLPPAFRRRYGQAMRRELARALVAHLRAGGGVVSFWARATAELLGGIVPTWLRSTRGAGPARRRFSRGAGPARPRSSGGTGPAPEGSGGSGSGLAMDFRYAVRALRKAPAVTATCVVTIALGIGANTAVLTAVNEILLRPVPIHEPSRLVDLHVEQPGANSFSGFSYPELLDYRERADVFAAIAGSAGVPLFFGEGQGQQMIPTQIVTDGYFEMMGLVPALGRAFTADESRLGGPFVVIVSHGFWQRRLGGDPQVLGAELPLQGTTATVIGVMPPDYNGRFIGFPSEIWAPLSAMSLARPAAVLEDRSDTGLELIGRLADGVDQRVAAAEIDAVATQLEREFPDMGRGRRVSLTPYTGLDSSLRMPVIGFLGVLGGLAGLVLLAACLNVGNLLLARGHARSAELATRMALGGTRARVVRQLLTETVLLFLAGAGLAAVLAAQLTRGLRLMIGSLPIPLALDLGIDARVLALTSVVTLVTALATGLSPALRATRTSHSEVLRSATHGSADSARLRRLFVAGQVAVSVVLLVAAALFVRAFREGQRLDPGFVVADLHLASVGLPAERYSTEQAWTFFETLVEDLGAHPDVASVSLATASPLGVARTPRPITIPGRELPAGADALIVDANVVGRAYFETVGIEVVEGRTFELFDGPGERRVAVVNETLARRTWPGDGAVGQTIRVDGNEAEVVGVVRDSRYLIQERGVGPLLYLHAAQRPVLRYGLVVRGGTAAVGAAVRASLAELDPALPPPLTNSVENLLATFLLPQRIASRIAGGLGAIGFLLAVTGVYGLVTYSLGQRRREFGIRMALGSTPASLVRLVMRTGTVLVGVGAGVGLVGALLLAPLLRSFLVGISPTDPLTLLVVIGGLVAAATAAAYYPARRAAAIDPVRALRQE